VLDNALSLAFFPSISESSRNKKVLFLGIHVFTRQRARVGQRQLYREGVWGLGSGAWGLGVGDGGWRLESLVFPE